MAEIFFHLFVVISGLIVGSFISAYTYRAPIDKSVKKGRSYCPNCKRTINWQDNIPVFSYLILRGKCRKCRKHISKRYPIIESSTAFGFLTISILINNCAIAPRSSDLCQYYGIFGSYALPFLLLIIAFLITVFVIDLEHQLILDEVVFSFFTISFFAFLIVSSQTLLPRLLTGFGSSSFLLFIHLITKRKGMGLGDVKFALPAGFILGWPSSLSWLFISFVIGAVVGIVLIALNKAKFSQQIAFGPFLVFGVLFSLIWGNSFVEFLFPYLF